MNLPTLGQVTYYMADDEIPVSAPGLTMVSILPNTTYALYNTGKNRFMLITPKRQMNIDGSTALELSQSGTVIKTEIGEGKVMKKGILESLLFLEAESAISAAETDPVVVPDVSLDQKVDRYLIRYEREAVPTSAVYSPKVQTQVNTANGAQSSGGTAAPLPPYSESKVSKKGLLESMLFEADPSQEVPGGPPAGGMDAGGFGGAGDDPAADMGGDLGGEMGDPGADASAEKTPPVIDTPKMNLNDYCRAVARLISNYEALLDPKTTIFNRAKEYVRVNYDEATSKMFEEIMTDKLGINPTPPERDARMAPPASNAIYGGDGGGGAG